MSETAEQDELQAILEKQPDVERGYRMRVQGVGSTPECAENKPSYAITDYSQWLVCPNDSFRPIGATKAHLERAVYTIDSDNLGIVFTKTQVLTDSLVALDDSASLRVIAGIQQFWKSAESFRKHGILFKRGVLLWGPPGSGKTVTVAFLMRELLRQGGIVVLCRHPKLVLAGLEKLRRIEPDRPLIIVLEDIEEIIQQHGEHELLALLDGEHQVANVVNIATTNYPELLGARIVNRPSRFDEVIKVGMPSPASRRSYLVHSVNFDGIEESLDKWIADTEGLSIAHLRELVAATQCLGQPYEETLQRLKHMKVAPNSGGGNGLGF